MTRSFRDCPPEFGLICSSARIAGKRRRCMPKSDQELREQPVWQPPPGFAERVSLQGLASLSKAPARPQGFYERIYRLLHLPCRRFCWD